MPFIATITNGELDFGSDVNLERWFRFKKSFEGKKIRIEPTNSQRTYSQNAALHLWFEMMAKELNDAGYTVQLVLMEKVDLDWDAEKVKELLWRPAQKALLGKKSTTELKNVEDIDKVWEHLNRHLGEKFGVHCDFPNDPNKIK